MKNPVALSLTFHEWRNRVPERVSTSRRVEQLASEPALWTNDAAADTNNRSPCRRAPHPALFLIVSRSRLVPSSLSSTSYRPASGLKTLSSSALLGWTGTRGTRGPHLNRGRCRRRLSRCPTHPDVSQTALPEGPAVTGPAQ